MAKTRNANWEATHATIRDVFLHVLERNKGRKPTLAELAHESGLSHKTIERHVKSLEFKPQLDSWRVMTGDVVAALWRKCMKGDSNAIKLWFQVVEGYTEHAARTEDTRGTDYPALFQAALRATAGGHASPGSGGMVQ